MYKLHNWNWGQHHWPFKNRKVSKVKFEGRALRHSPQLAASLWRVWIYADHRLCTLRISYFTRNCGFMQTTVTSPLHWASSLHCALHYSVDHQHSPNISLSYHSALHFTGFVHCSVDLCKCRFVHFHLYFACCTAFILFFILHSTDLKWWEDLQVASSKTGGGGFTIGIGGVWLAWLGQRHFAKIFIFGWWFTRAVRSSLSSLN